VSVALTHALLAGVPLLIMLILALLIFRRPSHHPKSYTLSEPWTYGPILWAATDEKVGGGHGHGSVGYTVGGGASGRW
jgi:hypothetical protein